MYLPSYSNSKMTTRQPGLVPKISLRITNPLFRTITIEAAFQPPDHTPGHSLCPVKGMMYSPYLVGKFYRDDVTYCDCAPAYPLPTWEILPRRRRILRLLLPHILLCFESQAKIIYLELQVETFTSVSSRRFIKITALPLNFPLVSLNQVFGSHYIVHFLI